MSVILPLHNGEKWVANAVRSVLCEPEVVEVVVVENGSTDNSRLIVQDLQCKNPKVQLIFLHGSPSISAARNLGIRHSQGEFLAFIDQDDIWVEGRLEKQLVQLLGRPDPSYSIGFQEFRLDPHLQSGAAPTPQWFRSDWLKEPQIGYVFGTLLIHRKSFNLVGYLDETLTYGWDDVDWFARAKHQRLKELRLSETLLLRTIHDRNFSSNPARTKEGLSLIRKQLSQSSSAKQVDTLK